MTRQWPSRLRDVQRACEDAGWTADWTRSGHPRISPPRGLRFVVDRQGATLGRASRIDGVDVPVVAVEGSRDEDRLPAGYRLGDRVPPVTFAATPSDHRGDMNSRKALTRAGVRL